MSTLDVVPAVPPAQDSRVEAFWRRLGLPGLIDIHTHFLPDRMQRRVWAHFDQTGPLIGRPWPITYRWSHEDRLAYLPMLGVRHFTALSYAHRPGMAADLSDWSLTLAADTPGCLPSATFYPEDGVEAYVGKALERGAVVFKVHAQVGGFDLRAPALDPVWGLLAEAGTPVVVHIGSGPVPRDGITGPAPLAGVLQKHPDLVAVVAHLGAPEYADFIAIAERYPRVHLDTTMAFTDFFAQVAPFPGALLPRLAALGDRVLLGSDFPNIPYPYHHQLEALERLGLGDAWLRKVCWDNASRLLGLGGRREPALVFREVPYDSDVVATLTEEVQQEYVTRYGGRDATPVDVAEFAAPQGTFLVAELDGEPIGCGGLRRRPGAEVEIKRMFVRTPFRRRGYALSLLTELEDRARAGGAQRVVLETGLMQPEAIALYEAAGYEPVEGFGHYRDSELSRCFGKVV